jgi:squalene synthase HpnC
MTKLSLDELLELTSPDGGRFAIGSLADAQAFCRKIACLHYENFPVGSVIVDRNKREHFYSIYTFARIADDIADEFQDNNSDRIDALDRMSDLIDESFNYPENIKNPLFIALTKTIKEKNIPPDTLKKLLIAFKRDILFEPPDNILDLEDYCKYSANPIGELVLRIYDAYNEITAPLSDSICTGLQLVNFWQDFSRDLPVGRLYIPADLISKYQLSSEEILSGNPDMDKFKRLISEIYDITEKYFADGTSILQYLKQFRLRTEIALTIRGGLLVLEKSRKKGTAILKDRPKLNKINYIELIILAFIDGLNFKNRTG